MKVELSGKYYEVPKQWNELSSGQLLSIVDIFYGKSTISLADQFIVFKILFCLSNRRMKKVDTDELLDKLYLIHFLLTGNTLIKNLFPTYKGFHGPADDFNTLLVCEFIFSEGYYRMYKDFEKQGSPAIASLNNLIAVLYRPGRKGYDMKCNPDGDVREPYNDNLTPHYASQIAKWPIRIKYAILHWFEGCYQNLINNNPELFGGGGGEPSLYGLWSVMRGVAEKGIHGDIKQVEKLYVKVFMMELNEMIREAKKINQLTAKTT